MFQTTNQVLFLLLIHIVSDRHPPQHPFIIGTTLGPAAGCQGRHGVQLHGARAQRNHRGVQRQILPGRGTQSWEGLGSIGTDQKGLVIRESV